MSEMIQRNDRHIQQDAETDLRWDPRVTIKEVNVIVSQGIVTIFGEVSNLSEKLAAKHIVKHIAGVKDVINELKVKIPDEQKQSDTEILKAITHVFLWNQQVPRDLRLSVKDSWVTLKGDVAWPFQKKQHLTPLVQF
ncbi:unnamed protein product [Sphagnum jensenii]|uniref:BON domain-containing protein n=1 Tax=Sphagnum jensenii TaxID=128206 RepID=A0ABP0VH94_9BRYO